MTRTKEYIVWVSMTNRIPGLWAVAQKPNQNLTYGWNMIRNQEMINQPVRCLPTDYLALGQREIPCTLQFIMRVGREKSFMRRGTLILECFSDQVICCLPRRGLSGWALFGEAGEKVSILILVMKAKCVNTH